VSGEEEKIEASKSSLFFGSLMIAVWIAVGTAAFWVINPLFGWRRQMCGSCYYCVSCTKGFAKLSRLFLGGSSIPGISKGSTVGMTVFIYLLLSIIPGMILVLSIFQEFSLLKLSLLICLLLISTYNAASRGKKFTRD
jgi:hypothetical protein